VLDAILLYIGCYILYWARIWYLYGSRVQMMVSIQMMICGGLAVFAGIFVAWKIKCFLWPPIKVSKARKLIVTVGASVFDAFLLYIGCYILYWEAFDGSLYIGASIQMVIYGSLIIVVGIFVAWKIKCFLWPPKKAPQKSPPLKDNGGDLFG